MVPAGPLNGPRRITQKLTCHVHAYPGLDNLVPQDEGDPGGAPAPDEGVDRDLRGDGRGRLGL